MNWLALRDWESYYGYEGIIPSRVSAARPHGPKNCLSFRLYWPSTSTWSTTLDEFIHFCCDHLLSFLGNSLWPKIPKKKNGDHHNHTLQKNDSFFSNTKKKYMFVHSSKAVNSLIFSASANGSSAGGNNSWCEWLPQQAMRLRGLLHVYPGEN